MSISTIVSKPGFQRLIWGVLRSFAPVLRFRKSVFVSCYSDVIEVLKRDKDFTISEVNAARMKELGLTFFLGMDASEQHSEEFALMAKVVKREDIGTIQSLVAKKAKELISQALPTGQIDVVNQYARLVPLYLIDVYFGIPVRDENKMRQWMRSLFHHLFLNLTNDPKIQANAKVSAEELKKYLAEVITERKKTIQNQELADNVLNRLLLAQKETDWISDDVIIRNISGFIIGSVDTTSKSTVLAIEELMKFPAHLRVAKACAKNNDIYQIGKYMLEALRFNPHNPIVLRYAKNAASIGSGGKTYKIPADSTVYVGITSAMFDKKAVLNPGEINLERKTEYLHFSYGMHTCSGKYINMVQIPELMAGLLRLENIRRSDSEGERKIKYEGPFPDRFILKFDK